MVDAKTVRPPISTTRPPSACCLEAVCLESPNYAVLSREGGKAGAPSFLPFCSGGVHTRPNQRSRQSHVSVHVLTVVGARVAGAGENLRDSSSRRINCILERDNYSNRVIEY